MLQTGLTGVRAAEAGSGAAHHMPIWQVQGLNPESCAYAASQAATHMCTQDECWKMWYGVPLAQTTEVSLLLEETYIRQKDAAVEEAGNLSTQRLRGSRAELPRRAFPGHFLTTAAAPSLSPPASLFCACERLVISPEPSLSRVFY